MYISRIAEKVIKDRLLNRKVLMMLGARQVGKTTLVKKVLQSRNAVFFNFDAQVDLDRFKSLSSVSAEEAMKSLGNPDVVIIDEAQRWPKTAQVVKGWYDYEVKCKIILLGSSSLNILDQAAESLTGRNEKLFLSPLTFEEIVASQSWYLPGTNFVQITSHFSAQIKELLMQSLVFGGYPEVVVSGNREELLLNLVSDYLLKDILNLGLVKSPEMIKRLLQLLAHQAGSEVSVSELSVNLQTSRATVEKYLDLLEETYVIFRLPAFSTNPRKEIAKSRKIYFWDTGIRNAVLGEFSQSELRPDIGALWENWVVAEFAKHNLLTGSKSNLYFWRSRFSGEVDLVIKKGQELKAYEIKWQAQKIKKRAFENEYHINVELIHSAMPLIKFFDDSLPPPSPET